MKCQGAAVRPMSGAQVEELIAGFYNTRPDIVKKAVTLGNEGEK